MKLLWKLRTHEPTDQKRFCNGIYLKAVRSALSSICINEGINDVSYAETATAARIDRVCWSSDLYNKQLDSKSLGVMLSNRKVNSGAVVTIVELSKIGKGLCK
jgi:hypothetical protein